MLHTLFSNYRPISESLNEIGLELDVYWMVITYNSQVFTLELHFYEVSALSTPIHVFRLLLWP